MKKDQLEKGQYYYNKLDAGIEYIFYFDGDICSCYNIEKGHDYLYTAGNFSSDDRKFRLATFKERSHLKACIKAKTFVEAKLEQLPIFN